MHLLLLVPRGACPCSCPTPLHHTSTPHYPILQVSLAGLWLMPAIIGVLLKFWRFLAIWVAYSAVTGYLMSLCMQKKMHHSTPRKVQ